MQLDKTSIVIRERGMLETMDMSLHVLARNIGPLMGLMLLGALPFALLNQWMIGWMVTIPDDEPFSQDHLLQSSRYLFAMFLLIYIEAQWASAFATTYLGKSVFTDRPSWKSVIREAFAIFPRLIMCQGILRGVIFALILTATIDRDSTFSPQEVWLLMIAMVAAMIRSTRPFINEILLLERNPLREKPGVTQTAAKRSSMLHTPAVGQSIARSLLLSVTNVMLFLSLFGTTIFISGTFLFDWIIGPFMIQVNYVAVLWALVMFSTVYRFLSYLDVRIRQEGWEVELRLRAEAARMAKAVTT